MEVVTTERATFDEVLKDIRKEIKGTDEPIKVRIQPQTSHPSKGWLAWPGIVWTVHCSDVEEVRSVRKALDEFFDALQRVKGTQPVIEALKSVPSADV